MKKEKSIIFPILLSLELNILSQGRVASPECRKRFSEKTKRVSISVRRKEKILGFLSRDTFRNEDKDFEGSSVLCINSFCSSTHFPFIETFLCAFYHIEIKIDTHYCALLSATLAWNHNFHATFIQFIEIALGAISSALLEFLMKKFNNS